MDVDQQRRNDYSAEWYRKRGKRNQLLAAQQLLAVLNNYIKPASVVDVGCGIGEYLHVYQSQGVKTVLGIDGPWVDKDKLLIDADHFMEADLELSLDLGRRYDLVISTEVAEHIPEASADVFVDTLVRHGDIILFSAAIPLQGGNHHVNEQWPQYWADKFKARGYVAIDCLRRVIWSNPDIKHWQKQNLLFFCKEDALKEYPRFESGVDPENTVLPLVHPFLYEYYARNFRRISTRVPGFIKPMLHRFFK